MVYHPFKSLMPFTDIRLLPMVRIVRHLAVWATAYTHGASIEWLLYMLTGQLILFTMIGGQVSTDGMRTATMLVRLGTKTADGLLWRGDDSWRECAGSNRM